MAVVRSLTGHEPRVSLRLRVRAPEPGVTDVVGLLVEDSPVRVTVLPDDSPAVVVPQEDVLALRRIPARPVRPASSAERLGRFLAGHWPGLETARLGGWQLRAGGGFTRRANSVVAVGDPGCPVPRALDLVTRWYADRGLPVLLQMIGRPAPPCGWGVVDDIGEVSVLVGEMRHLSLSGRPVPHVRVSDRPSPAWSDLWRGGAGRHEPAASVLTAVAARYLTLHTDDTPGAPAIGCARVVVDRRWAHVSSLEVTPESRGRGLGRSLMEAALTEAVTHPGAEPTSFVALEVEEDNLPATRLYASMGLRTHHRYHYLCRAADAVPRSTTGDRQ